MLIFFVALLALGALGLGYLFGCHVGARESWHQGVSAGRRQADSEWGVFLEHGAV